MLYFSTSYSTIDTSYSTCIDTDTCPLKGHAGFRVDDGNQSMFHMGDIIHVPKLQLSDQNICTLFDIDPDAALTSRKYALDMAASDNLLCTSGHMLEPKFVYLEKHGTSYITIS